MERIDELLGRFNPDLPDGITNLNELLLRAQEAEEAARQRAEELLQGQPTRKVKVAA